MAFLRSLLLAFSTFSRFPVPKVEWKPESMRYLMCFFPLVGLAIGLLLALWALLCQAAGFGTALRAAGVVVIPAVASGGIHLDGFADTCDALASNAGLERRREILKDPHAGAFAMVGLCLYFLVAFAFACEFDPAQHIALLVIMPAFSRCLSGIATVGFAPGVGKGMLFEFHNAANRRGTLAVLALVAMACGIATLIASPLCGLCMTCVGMACLAGMHYLSESAFMGMSGDLAGFFLQVCELAFLACIALAA